MPDIYAKITEIDPAIAEQIANAMEIRAANPQQRNMLDSYLSQIAFPNEAQVLEIGCGSGPAVRRLGSVDV
jgi:cyclopropane fatty-acyl-phospholipid synthase-like methyltransferase